LTLKNEYWNCKVRSECWKIDLLHRSGQLQTPKMLKGKILRRLILSLLSGEEYSGFSFSGARGAVTNLD
jgi:hypothetical protein